MKIISCQRYLDDSIVNEKLEEQNYTVGLSEPFLFEEEHYQIVIDGHHRLAAAREAGVEPEYYLAYDNNIRDNLDGYEILEHYHHAGDSDYYDIETGLDIW